MTYWNLVDRYGVEAFARDLANAGGSGLITPDLLPDEADDWLAASEAHGLDRIFLVSPSSGDERIASTAAACRGWMYATAVMGVTGTRTASSSVAPGLVARIRALAPQTLVGVASASPPVTRPQRSPASPMRSSSARRSSRPMLAAEANGNPDDLSGLRARSSPTSPRASRALSRSTPEQQRLVRSAKLLLTGALALALLAGCTPAATVTGSQCHTPGYLGAELTTPYQFARRGPRRPEPGSPSTCARAVRRPVLVFFFGYTNCSTSA